LPNVSSEVPAFAVTNCSKAFVLPVPFLAGATILLREIDSDRFMGGGAQSTVERSKASNTLMARTEP